MSARSPREDDPCFREWVRGIGRAVRRRRRKKRWTLETLAERAGLTPRMVGYCEAGQRVPSLRALWSVALALGTPPQRLL